MGLYIKLHTDALWDAKCLAVGPLGHMAWIRGLLMAKQALSDGFIADAMIPMVCAGLTPEEAKQACDDCVKAGLWQRVKGGYTVGAEKWARYQTTKDQVEEKRKATAERVRAFRERKAEENAALVTQMKRDCNAVTRDDVTPPVTQVKRSRNATTETETKTETEQEKTICRSAESQNDPSGPLGSANAAPRDAPEQTSLVTRTHPFTAVVFPVNGGKVWRMDDALANQLAIAYPKLDIAQELDRAKAWLLANPSRMKTARGMGRFVSNWMSTADTRRQVTVAAGAKAQPERSYRGENDPTIDWWAGAEEHKAALEEAMRLEEAAGQ